MRLFISIVLAFFLLPVFRLAAEDKIRWETFTEKETKHFIPSAKGTAAKRAEEHPGEAIAGKEEAQPAEVDYLYLKPVSGAPPTVLAKIEQTLARSFQAQGFAGDDYDTKMSPRELLKEGKDRFFKAYQEDLDCRLDTGLPTLTSDHWFSIWTVQVGHETPTLLCVKGYYHDYAGGMHDLAMTSYFIFDKRTGDVFSHEQILRPNSNKAVTELIKRELRKDKRIGPTNSLEEAGVWEEKISPGAGEIFITQDGLGTHFNEYSIACYAFGPTDILIRWAEIKPYLTDEFRHLALSGK